jgi:glycosyltransferase involved in cell wall biosynthesis
MPNIEADSRIPAVDEPAVSLSVVVPVFNEQESLEVLDAEICAVLDPAGLPYEVLYVDDGSTDRSPEILRRLSAGDPRRRVLRQTRNSGQSAAFAAGFRLARGAVVVTMDADLQNDPTDIPRLLAVLNATGGPDVVCGVRRDRQDSWVRKLSSRIANGVRNRLTAESIADVGCSLKAYRVEFVRRVPMFTGMHRFLPTLLRLDGARVAEVDVHHRPRRFGVAKYGIGNRLFRALADLFAVRWMQKRWIDRRLTKEEK